MGFIPIKIRATINDYRNNFGLLLLEAAFHESIDIVAVNATNCKVDLCTSHLANVDLIGRNHHGFLMLGIIKLDFLHFELANRVSLLLPKKT